MSALESSFLVSNEALYRWRIGALCWHAPIWLYQSWIFWCEVSNLDAERAARLSTCCCACHIVADPRTLQDGEFGSHSSNQPGSQFICAGDPVFVTFTHLCYMLFLMYFLVVLAAQSMPHRPVRRPPPSLNRSF